MATQRLFCTFRLNGRLFGVEVLDVKEVTVEARVDGSEAWYTRLNWEVSPPGEVAVAAITFWPVGIRMTLAENVALPALSVAVTAT